jgi:2-hydroxy-6-oxo-6-(2'-aminophenyl)hexa-2,4-dienoate hydrolase
MADQKFDPTMRGYESRYLDAAGIRTHFLETGSGETVVLVHGGGPGADGYGNWYSCLPAFAENFHAVAVDMLGFGRTGKPDPAEFDYTQSARVRHLTEFLIGLDRGPVTLIGNSMGGCTSLGVAAERPELVRRLILMGAAGIKTEALSAAVEPLARYDGTVDAMQSVVGALTHESYQVDPALLQYRVDISVQPDTIRAQKATMGWVMQNGLHYDDAYIAEVKTPALVVGGKDDPIVTPAQNFRFLELLENSWGYLIPHTGHWVMMERPEEFTELCTRFIQRVNTSP